MKCEIVFFNSAPVGIHRQLIAATAYRLPSSLIPNRWPLQVNGALNNRHRAVEQAGVG